MTAQFIEAMAIIIKSRSGVLVHNITNNMRVRRNGNGNVF